MWREFKGYYISPDKIAGNDVKTNLKIDDSSLLFGGEEIVIFKKRKNLLNKNFGEILVKVLDQDRLEVSKTGNCNFVLTAGEVVNSMGRGSWDIVPLEPEQKYIFTRKDIWVYANGHLRGFMWFDVKEERRDVVHQTPFRSFRPGETDEEALSVFSKIGPIEEKSPGLTLQYNNTLYKRKAEVKY